MEIPSGEAQWIALRAAERRRDLDEAALVLQSLGLPHGHLQRGGMHLLLVPSEVEGRARDELARYDAENVGWRPRQALYSGRLAQGLVAAAAFAGAMVALGWWQWRGAFGVQWATVGHLDGSRVPWPEPWRAATALTLHGGLTHWLGNLMVGCLFLVLLGELVGGGVALAAALATASAANLANGWIQGEGFHALGASTLNFAALALLGAFHVRRRGAELAPGRKKWVPLLVGIGLFGWLGVGNIRENTAPEMIRVLRPNLDLWGHALGFVFGALGGFVLGAGSSRRLLAWPLQNALLAGTLIALAAAWTLAIAT